MRVSSHLRAVGIWLLLVALFVLAMIIVGGATRLTDSGLSITEWRPVTGMIPPLSTADWLREFALYKASGEYQMQNAGMSLAAFKVIYGWEWAHRFLGRIVGVVFVVPLVVFTIQRRIPGWLMPRLLGLLALGGLQGFVGWWMVKSGIVDRVDVLPERLAAHLGLAVVLLAGLVYTALDCLRGQSHEGPATGPWPGVVLVFGMAVYLQILLGALVAGNDAGRIFTDWPSMDGQIWPAVYWDASRDLWGNFAHNPAMVQMHHRLGGYLVFVLAIILRWRLGRAARGVYLVAVAQVALGVLTLMLAAPVALSLLHQTLAAILWVKVVVLAHQQRGGAH